ncbi:Sarcoplasmic calcium-binding protein, alpha-B and -A chains [Eumeta japonica]|uniref:Sarcoplasmic calcium-binding protein, alpha-B and-A chains n=1 Tax=Eumeta variegata TaxID=151549 RepID=A0A4C1YUJ4_EUMVA|nr:Sarcoplasmic calcium-binding protein, alpha-B and -A chains [Eumeta japonica]
MAGAKPLQYPSAKRKANGRFAQITALQASTVSLANCMRKLLLKEIRFRQNKHDICLPVEKPWRRQTEASSFSIAIQPIHGQDLKEYERGLGMGELCVKCQMPPEHLRPINPRAVGVRIIGNNGREIDASQAECLGRPCLSIASSALSLARSAQAERDNESCFFLQDRKRGGLTLSRYQELFAQFLGDTRDDCDAKHLFGPLEL